MLSGRQNGLRQFEVVAVDTGGARGAEDGGAGVADADAVAEFPFVWATVVGAERDPVGSIGFVGDVSGVRRRAAGEDGEAFGRHAEIAGLERFVLGDAALGTG